MMTMPCVCFLHASSVEVKVCGKQAGSLRVELTIFYEQVIQMSTFGVARELPFIELPSFL